jgi:hypothetical protein
MQRVEIEFSESAAERLYELNRAILDELKEIRKLLATMADVGRREVRLQTPEQERLSWNCMARLTTGRHAPPAEPGQDRPGPTEQPGRD